MHIRILTNESYAFDLCFNYSKKMYRACVSSATIRSRANPAKKTPLIDLIELI